MIREFFDQEMSPDEFRKQVLVYPKARKIMRTRPILGGVFGQGAFHLATVATQVDGGGLDRLHVMVIHDLTAFPLSVGATRAEALGRARKVIERTRPTQLALFLGEVRRIQLADERVQMIARAEAERDELNARVNQPGVIDFRAKADERPFRAQPVSRRRRAIFEKSEGRCHYCACELTLEGRWHVEHMIPRALGGQSVEDNLVAACAPCNHKKRDQTDHEFIARREVAK
jgi:hypothetical protein